MSRPTHTGRTRRRRTISAALAAATVASSLVVGFAAPASADLLDLGTGSIADIRVLPFGWSADAPDGADNTEDQPAPTILAGGSGAGASMQIVLNNQWENNDHIDIAVLDRNNDNCTGTDPADGAIAYSTEPTVVVDGPYNAGALAPNDGSPDPFGGADTLDPAVDSAGTDPNFSVSLESSTQCGGIATDVIRISFIGESTPASDVSDEFVFTISDVAYTVGAEVPAGPVHNAAYGFNATEIVGIFTPTDTFGGNIGEDPPTTVQWTNSAYVSPVTVTVGGPNSLRDDGTLQALGDVTITEIQTDAFRDGTITLTFSNLTDMGDGPDPTCTLTERAGATLDCAVTSFNEVTLTLGGIDPDADPQTLGNILIEGLFAQPLTTGPIQLALNSPEWSVDFFTPDDQTDGNSAISDVNLAGEPCRAIPDFGPSQCMVVADVGTSVALGTRIGGQNRYGTAANIATQGLGECSNRAVLASGENFPDALSANYLAGALTEVFGDYVPILLTPRDTTSTEALSAMRQLGVQTVYIVGGPAAVSTAVENTLRATPNFDCGGDAPDSSVNLEVLRIFGPTRYETNNAIVNEVSNVFGFEDFRSLVQTQFGSPAQRTAILATGENFPDALASGPLAYGACTSNGDGCDDKFAFPLILTNTGSLHPSATQTLTDHDIEQVIILGGPNAVSDAVQAAVEAMGIDTLRLDGATRIETAIEVAKFARAESFPSAPSADADAEYDGGLSFGCSNKCFFETVFLARQDLFPDALAGGPIAAFNQTNILLTDTAALSQATADFLAANRDFYGTVIALGLGAAVSTAALEAANAAAS